MQQSSNYICNLYLSKLRFQLFFFKNIFWTIFSGSTNFDEYAVGRWKEFLSKSSLPRSKSQRSVRSQPFSLRLYQKARAFFKYKYFLLCLKMIKLFIGKCRHKWWSFNVSEEDDDFPSTPFECRASVEKDESMKITR